MSHLHPTAPSKGRGIWTVLALIVLGLYGIGLFLYHDMVIRVAVPVLLLVFAGIHFYQGLGKLRRAHDVKWYTQYNIMLSLFWLSCFALFPAIFLLPDKYGATHTILVGVLFGIAIAFFAYTFFLFYLHRRNLIRSAGYPQE